MSGYKKHSCYQSESFQINLDTMKEAGDTFEREEQNFKEVKEDFDQTLRLVQPDSWSGEDATQLKELGSKYSSGPITQTLEQMGEIKSILQAGWSKGKVLKNYCEDLEDVLKGEETQLVEASDTELHGLLRCQYDQVPLIELSCEEVVEQSHKIRQGLQKIEDLLEGLSQCEMDVGDKIEDLREDCKKIERLEEGLSTKLCKSLGLSTKLCKSFLLNLIF